MTMVTNGTIRSSTRTSEGTTRRDPSFLRAERRKRTRAAKRCLGTTAQLGTRCLDKVQTSPVQAEGLQEKSERKTAKRAGRRDRHRVVVHRREVEKGLLNLVNQQGGTEQDPKTRRVGLHSLLATATLYGSHTQLTKSVARVQGNRSSEQTEAQERNPAQQWVAVDSQDPPTVPSTQRSQEDGILLIVPAQLYGHRVRALVDSGATRCYTSPDIQLAAGINCTASNTFLELADGTQILSAGKAPAVLFSVGVNSFRMDFTVTKLLHGVDLVLGMHWLQRVNPLIDWTMRSTVLGLQTCADRHSRVAYEVPSSQLTGLPSVTSSSPEPSLPHAEAW